MGKIGDYFEKLVAEATEHEPKTEPKPESKKEPQAKTEPKPESKEPEKNFNWRKDLEEKEREGLLEFDIFQVLNLYNLQTSSLYF